MHWQTMQFFWIFISPLPPTIETYDATSVSATRANFEGNVTSSGGIPPQVKIYYGTNDGGTNPTSWASVFDIGNKATGEFSNLIGDLQPKYDLSLSGKSI